MISITNKPSYHCFTSELSQIKISTNHEKINVAVSMRNIAGNLFYEEYWVYNGSVTVDSLNDIIEDYMRSYSYAVQAVTVTASYGSESDSFNIMAYYCDKLPLVSIDASSFATDNFLSTLKTRRVAPDSWIYVSSYYSQGTTVTVNYNARNTETEELFSGSYNVSVSTNDYVAYLSLSVKSIQDRAAASKSKASNIIEILSFSLTYGSRYTSYFIDKSLANGKTFFFRNCFNAWDFITVPDVTVTKSEVSRSLASLGSRSVLYDNSVTKSFETQTGPLTVDEAEFSEQLASSHSVYHVVTKNPDYLVSEILITDSEISHSNEDNTQSVKFTWQFSDARPPLSLLNPTRIFTKEYSPIFS